MGPLLGVARLEFMRLLRSRVTLGLLLVVPAFQLILFGYAIAPSRHPLAVAISAPSREEADDFVRRLAQWAPEARVVATRAGQAEAAGAAGPDDVLVSIELPVRRSPTHPDAPVLPIRVVIDGSDAPRAAAAARRIEAIFWRTRALSDRQAHLRAGLQIRYAHNPALKDNWTFLPSLSGVLVMIAMLMLGCLSIARERETGTWETFQSLPVGALQSVLGRLLPGTAIGVLQGMLVVCLGHLLFGVPVPSSAIWLLLVILPLFACAHLAIGMAMSMRAATQLAALQGAVAFYLPAMLLSGFLYSTDAMPKWAQWIGLAFPLTHYVRAARHALLRDAGAADVLAAAPPVLLVMLVALSLALLSSRRAS